MDDAQHSAHEYTSSTFDSVDKSIYLYFMSLFLHNISHRGAAPSHFKSIQTVRCVCMYSVEQI